ncbi:hypothetical protein L227DRAFT_426919 [Lentinus tigrinus ALCF2SS1-6]|uniref:Uncharacterized protein n=1 Tax=Lentinus tigrinus ALCF2SS1-6 TaxID=1328759 RepID=A0A5C2RNI3_9APHY|nr:hypothetical protein L227DRAFT_426919 [Lentinus tigrinus ALCF2SS1-6]
MLERMRTANGSMLPNCMVLYMCLHGELLCTNYITAPRAFTRTCIAVCCPSCKRHPGRRASVVLPRRSSTLSGRSTFLNVPHPTCGVPSILYDCSASVRVDIARPAILDMAQ